MRASGWLNNDGITWSNGPAMLDSRHDACLADDALRCLGCDFLQQTRSKCINLGAGIAKARDPKDHLFADTQQGVAGQAEQVDAFGGDILAQITGVHIEPLVCEFFKQFAMDQVHLAQIGLIWIDSHAREVLDEFPGVRVIFDTQPGNYPDFIAWLLREAVLVRPADCDDSGAHAQLMQRVAIGRAFNRASPIGSPQLAQVP